MDTSVGTSRKSRRMKRNVNSRSNLDMVSFQLHNVQLIDSNDLPLIEKTIKTYNSASRCALKHFNEIGLRNLMKGRKPLERKVKGHFLDFRMVDGHPVYEECPSGMSDEMWLRMREESYSRKRTNGLKSANRFWQLDKDLGSPIAGTTRSVREWADGKGYELDSVLLHDATMQGYRNYLAFEKKKARWQTSKNAPVFGELEARSRKSISKDEFQLTRNGSMTITGKAKVGNPKFKFDKDNEEIHFTFKRRRITFSYRRNRFSKKGLETIGSIVDFMNDGTLPVTITLTNLGYGKFNVTLTYSPKELSELKREYISHKKDVVSSIYVTDEAVCHTIVNSRTHRVLHSRVHFIDRESGESRKLKTIQQLKWDRKNNELANLEKRIANSRTTTAAGLLSRIFNVNEAYGVSKVIVETPKSRTKGNFNKSLIEFNRSKIDNSENCFISYKKFLALVRSNCSRKGIEFKKVDGSFIQMKAIMESNGMIEALKNASTHLIEKDLNNSDIYLTDWSRMVQDPSMLDWVKHLLHNRRNRQARCEIGRMFMKMAVEKAVSLIDTRSRCDSEEKGRHSCTGCSTVNSPIVV